MTSPPKARSAVVARTDIDLGPRAHRQLGELAPLIRSIDQQGFLQPLIVRPHPDIPGRYRLIAGRRCMDATADIGMNTVPVIVVHSLDQAVNALKERDRLDHTAELKLDIVDGCWQGAALEEFVRGTLRNKKALPDSARHVIASYLGTSVFTYSRVRWVQAVADTPYGTMPQTLVLQARHALDDVQRGVLKPHGASEAVRRVWHECGEPDIPGRTVQRRKTPPTLDPEIPTLSGFDRDAYDAAHPMVQRKMIREQVKQIDDIVHTAIGLRLGLDTALSEMLPPDLWPEGTDFTDAREALRLTRNRLSHFIATLNTHQGLTANTTITLTTTEKDT